jgi:hypothetical protein
MAVAGLVIPTACGAVEQPSAVSPEVTAQLERIAQEHDGEVYYLGESFSGLPLTHAELSSGRSFFVYGSCNPGTHGGCAPPVQIQQTPIASPARYDTPWRGCVRLTIRGVPAAQFDGFEVYTGNALVKIYARSFGESKRAAAALRPVGGGDARAPLPAPTIDIEQALRECALESVPAKLAELRRYAKGPLYWLGLEFEGHPLARAEGDGHWARFLYGACVSPEPTDAACWPPVTVEQRPLDQFRPASWSPAVTCATLRIRGAPAALVRSAHELVLFTGDVALRLQGEDLDLSRRAADTVRALDQAVAQATLPAPPDTLEQVLQRTCPG